MSSGSFVFGRMIPWKRSTAPVMIASMSPRKYFDLMLFGRITTTLPPKSIVFSASTITLRDGSPLNS
jgi:hypothetical protein